MAYQETTTRSYGSRLGSSFRGIGSGFLAIAIGTGLLWWNEGRAVKTAKMLDEAQDVAVHVEDVSRVDSDYDGKLIHACADVVTEDSLSDPMFNVGAVAVRLDRKVEYYQWVEESHETTKQKIGGSEETTTTYTYKQKWVAEPINSSKFKDPEYQGKNKVVMPTPLEDVTSYAENVSFGAYRLPDFLIKSVSGTKTLTVRLPQEQLKQLNDLLIPAYTGKSITEYLRIKAQEMALAAVADSTGTVVSDANIYEFVHERDNTLYLGRSEATPEIGDVRITFTYVQPGRASVIARTQGDTFVKFTAKNGKSMSMLSMGDKSMEEMFQGAEDANNMLLWILRIAGLLIVIGGFKGIFGILQALFNVLPFLANIVGAGVGLVASVLGFVWSLIVVAIAWLFYRPIVAILLIVIAAAGIAFLVMKGKGKKIEAATE